jgi:hypothetical protein
VRCQTLTRTGSTGTETGWLANPEHPHGLKALTDQLSLLLVTMHESVGRGRFGVFTDHVTDHAPLRREREGWHAGDAIPLGGRTLRRSEFEMTTRTKLRR